LPHVKSHAKLNTKEEIPKDVHSRLTLGMIKSEKKSPVSFINPFDFDEGAYDLNVD
jgi:hypothetical protein